ncbi:hypothetical protein ABZU76_29710 [Amycolatopsis sp. NPDC005232]|uniref:hypothetical protein n=1 Tax=Amycolatopsis sp. NPDC005232 TaxID=3157027 RepID=UPI0033A1B3E0
MLELTEKEVVRRLFEELDESEFLNAIVADEHGQRRDEIIAALQSVEQQRDELAALWATPGELTTAEWQTVRRTLAEREQRLRAEFTAVPPPLANVDIAGRGRRGQT